MTNQRIIDFERREAMLNHLRIILQGGGQEGDRDRSQRMEAALQEVLMSGDWGIAHPMKLVPAEEMLDC